MEGFSLLKPLQGLLGGGKGNKGSNEGLFGVLGNVVGKGAERNECPEKEDEGMLSKRGTEQREEMPWWAKEVLEDRLIAEEEERELKARKREARLLAEEEQDRRVRELDIQDAIDRLARLDNKQAAIRMEEAERRRQMEAIAKIEEEAAALGDRARARALQQYAVERERAGEAASVSATAGSGLVHPLPAHLAGAVQREHARRRAADSLNVGNDTQPLEASNRLSGSVKSVAGALEAWEDMSGLEAILGDRNTVSSRALLPYIIASARELPPVAGWQLQAMESFDADLDEGPRPSPLDLGNSTLDPSLEDSSLPPTPSLNAKDGQPTPRTEFSSRRLPIPARPSAPATEPRKDGEQGTNGKQWWTSLEDTEIAAPAAVPEQQFHKAAEQAATETSPLREQASRSWWEGLDAEDDDDKGQDDSSATDGSSRMQISDTVRIALQQELDKAKDQDDRDTEKPPIALQQELDKAKDQDAPPTQRAVTISSDGYDTALSQVEETSEADFAETAIPAEWTLSILVQSLTNVPLVQWARAETVFAVLSLGNWSHTTSQITKSESQAWVETQNVTVGGDPSIELNVRVLGTDARGQEIWLGAVRIPVQPLKERQVAAGYALRRKDGSLIRSKEGHPTRIQLKLRDLQVQSSASEDGDDDETDSQWHIAESIRSAMGLELDKVRSEEKGHQGASEAESEDDPSKAKVEQFTASDRPEVAEMQQSQALKPSVDEVYMAASGVLAEILEELYHHLELQELQRRDRLRAEEEAQKQNLLRTMTVCAEVEEAMDEIVRSTLRYFEEKGEGSATSNAEETTLSSGPMAAEEPSDGVVAASSAEMLRASSEQATEETQHFVAGAVADKVGEIVQASAERAVAEEVSVSQAVADKLEEITRASSANAMAETKLVADRDSGRKEGEVTPMFNEEVHTAVAKVADDVTHQMHVVAGTALETAVETSDCREETHDTETETTLDDAVHRGVADIISISIAAFKQKILVEICEAGIEQDVNARMNRIIAVTLLWFKKKVNEVKEKAEKEYDAESQIINVVAEALGRYHKQLEATVEREHPNDPDTKPVVDTILTSSKQHIQIVASAGDRPIEKQTQTKLETFLVQSLKQYGEFLIRSTKMSTSTNEEDKEVSEASVHSEMSSGRPSLRDSERRGLDDSSHSSRLDDSINTDTSSSVVNSTSTQDPGAQAPREQEDFNSAGHDRIMRLAAAFQKDSTASPLRGKATVPATRSQQAGARVDDATRKGAAKQVGASSGSRPSPEKDHKKQVGLLGKLHVADIVKDGLDRELDKVRADEIKSGLMGRLNVGDFVKQGLDRELDKVREQEQATTSSDKGRAVAQANDPTSPTSPSEEEIDARLRNVRSRLRQWT